MILVLCSCAPNMSYAVPVRHRAPVAWHRVVHTGPKRKISMYFCVAPMAGQILMYRPLLTSKSATASMLMREHTSECLKTPYCRMEKAQAR